MDENTTQIIILIGKIVINLVVLFAIIYFPIWWSQKKKKYLEEECTILIRNIIFVVYWVIAIFIIGITLFVLWGMIDPVGKAHVDLIIGLTTIIGIVGAVWAVFARIDAEKAFRQSEKTFNALGSTFDFVSFFEKDKLQKIYSKIGTQNTKISLYFGFPILGLPYTKNKNLDIKPEFLFRDLLASLNSIKDKLEDNESIDFTLNIGYIDEQESINLLNDIPDIDAPAKTILSTRLKEFYILVDFFFPIIDPATKIRQNKYEKIQFVELELKEKFRFVTFNENADKQTFVWIVDIKKSKSGVLKPFVESIVFQTKDDRFLNLLEKVF